MSPNTVRIGLAWAYAIVAAVAVFSWAPARLIGPVVIILLSVPLVFRLAPRNYLYGVRTSRTLFTTEEIWYRQNVIGGIVMILVGVLWLAVVALR
jgi:hypothetical protein